jgi:dienelactone hydrolase
MPSIHSHPSSRPGTHAPRSHWAMVAKAAMIAAILVTLASDRGIASTKQLSVARRIDIEVRIGDRDGLPGTLTLPRGPGPFPVVVLVHGSGAHDRDETIGANKPFRDIAHGLAERGIAVLRYEKRTYRYRRLLSDEQLTIDRETTHDALLAIAQLRQTRMIDHRRIFVLGHSQGGMLAPRIAGRAPDVAGVILLAAPARPLMDLLVEQHRRISLLDDGVINDAEQVALRRLIESTLAIRAGLDPPASRLPMGLSARYWRSVDAVDPVAEAKAIRQPMLLLQGGRDLQVMPADWLRWRRAFADTPRVTFAHHDTLNHLGMHEHGPGSLRSYQVPGRVSAELIDDIALWIELLRGVRER